MATTTTNFGWDIPQSTDLVKDGATAIAALGQDIDTALIDLKGGTTGQVLSKASNTDLDYSWIAASSGKIKQVVTATYSTATTIASTTLTDIGLTATITPTASNSKILVLAMMHVEAYRSAPQQGVNVALFRGATSIWNAARWFFFDGNNQGVTDLYTTSTLTYVDSPATTSATTYKIQGAATYSTSSGQVVFQVSGTPSTITLLEIGA
jgi:hypothetical protein